MDLDRYQKKISKEFNIIASNVQILLSTFSKNDLDIFSNVVFHFVVYMAEPYGLNMAKVRQIASQMLSVLSARTSPPKLHEVSAIGFLVLFSIVVMLLYVFRTAMTRSRSRLRGAIHGFLPTIQALEDTGIVDEFYLQGFNFAVAVVEDTTIIMQLLSALLGLAAIGNFFVVYITVRANDMQLYDFASETFYNMIGSGVAAIGLGSASGIVSSRVDTARDRIDRSLRSAIRQTTDRDRLHALTGSVGRYRRMLRDEGPREMQDLIRMQEERLVARPEPGIPTRYAVQTVGIYKEHIRQLFTDLTATVENLVDELSQCPICYEPFNTTEHQPQLFACGHVVCSSCFSQIRALQCPICREPITTHEIFTEFLQLLEEFRRRRR